MFHTIEHFHFHVDFIIIQINVNQYFLIRHSSPQMYYRQTVIQSLFKQEKSYSDVQSDPFASLHYFPLLYNYSRSYFI